MGLIKIRMRNKNYPVYSIMRIITKGLKKKGQQEVIMKDNNNEILGRFKLISTQTQLIFLLIK